MNEFDYEKIDQYLEGELSGTELQAFESELKINEPLAKEVALYKTIQDDLRNHLSRQQKGASATENTLSQLNNKYFSAEKANTDTKVISIKNKKPLFYMLAVAASIALFFFIKPLLFSPGLSNQQLFTQYAQVENLDFTVRGDNNDSLKIIASKLYNEKNYAAALPLLETLSLKYPDETNLALAKGVAYLQTKKYEEAIKVFDSISRGNSVLKYEAVGYKAMVYLLQNNTEACITELSKIPPDASRYEQSIALIKKLKK